MAYETNKGVRVNSPLSEDERDVVVGMLFLQLEKVLYDKVYPKVTSSDLDQISILLERLSSACKRASLPEVAESDLALHRYWVAQASPDLESTWLGLSVRMIMKYTRLSRYEDIQKEHTEIVSAILEKDLEKTLICLESNII